VIDPFWLLEPTALAIPHEPYIIPQQLVNIKPTETKESRLTSSRTAFEPLAQLSSNSIVKTKNLLTTIHGLLRDLSIDDNDTLSSLIANPLFVSGQSQRRRQPNATGAPTTAANKAASRASNKEKRKKAQSDESIALGRK
jgi:hypothetical protein